MKYNSIIGRLLKSPLPTIITIVGGKMRYFCPMGRRGKSTIIECGLIYPRNIPLHVDFVSAPLDHRPGDVLAQ